MPLYSLANDTPQIASSAYIAPSADLIGRVVVDEQASVWFGAVLRGDDALISIGIGSNIQDNSVVHVDPGFSCTIGAYCTIGHAAIVHGAQLADHVLVGMGATVMNGVELGEGCVVGAGALIPEGKIFEPYSLIIGAPGKAIRQYDPKTIEARKMQAESYIQRAAHFSKALKVVDAD
jgi:carbonic anhydrase/acetyltransferase-like protein (isoleucine patch superfamily)